MFENIKQKEEVCMANISDRIKMLRTSAGLTQEEFGNIFGIVKSTVSLYESGKSCPNDQMKLKICNYFNVPLDFLIGISNVAEYKSEDFNKAILSDGSCHSALLDLMEIRHITMDDIVMATGLEKEVLEYWCVNEVPSVRQLILVADCLNTSVDYLLGRTDQFNLPSGEDKDVLSYYSQLRKIDKRWAVGQMIDILKKYESENESSVAADDQRKVVGK